MMLQQFPRELAHPSAYFYRGHKVLDMASFSTWLNFQAPAVWKCMNITGHCNIGCYVTHTAALQFLLKLVSRWNSWMMMMMMMNISQLRNKLVTRLWMPCVLRNFVEVRSMHSWEPSGESAPPPKTGRRKCAISSITLQRIVRFRSYFIQGLYTWRSKYHKVQVKGQRLRSQRDVIGLKFDKLRITQPGLVRFRSNFLQAMTTWHQIYHKL